MGEVELAEQIQRANPVGILRQLAGETPGLTPDLAERIYRIELDNQFIEDRARADHLIRAAVAETLASEERR